jgi:hypothetical protein
MGQSIFINFDTNNLKSSSVASATDLRTKKFTQFVAGDSLELDLFLVGTTGLLNIQDYSEVRLGIGQLDARPNAGTYQIGSNTPLAYNHSASELEAIIDADVASATVTKLTNFVFKISFESNGSQTIPSIDSRLLAPTSTVSVTKLTTGDASTKETWLWRLYQNPVAFTNSFSDITGQGIRGVLSLATSGVYDLLADNTEVPTNLELELTDSSGNVRTIMQAEVKLRGEVIGHNFTGSIPVSPSIHPSATTFLESFPNPTVAGNLDVDGTFNVDLGTSLGENVGVTGDLSTTEGEISNENGDFVATNGDFVATNGHFIAKNGNFVAWEGDIKANNGKIITKEIQCVAPDSNPDNSSPINYDSTEHRFRDFDASPTNLMVIKKIRNKGGARVGINVPATQDPKCALHIAYAGSSDGLPREALRVTGGAMFNEWVRVGHFTDTERDNLSNPTNGTIIYNDTHHEFQAYIGGAQGSDSRWQAFTMQNVST